LDEAAAVKRAVWNRKSEPIAAGLPDFRRFNHGFVRESVLRSRREAVDRLFAVSDRASRRL
jgi:hypothetical protein